MRCHSCATEVASVDAPCPACGSSPGVSEKVTLAGTPRPVDGAPAPSGRFPTGTLLAGRYLLVGPLGKGGMGEVYRAEDVKLGQTVALKFLPEALASDATWLIRFHNEVRVAREVTHPNVCRVHDIVEADGLHFLSMEYVDGEDLASLLRRIGRLPKDKGVELARQLCSGLGAAHARGILHRDLKPANVMIDGQGRVRITDFGLASLADAIDHNSVSAGTPAYMAPEQAAGQAVSIRSDLYALGLVLYEIFTGKPAFSGRTRAELLRAHRETTPTSPSDHVEDMDPAVERVILRCLEKDPRDRPASALAVSAALPGGDPLAAALAAGETPSPEMVAAAGGVGGLRPAVAWTLLGSCVLLIVLAFVAMLGWRLTLFQHVPIDLSPQVLADRGRQMLTKLRGAERAPFAAYGFDYDGLVIRHIAQRDPSTSRWDGLATGQPAAVYFWYRESPQPLEPNNRTGVVTDANPPLVVRGMVNLRLDTRGRLIDLRAVTPLYDDAKTEAPAPDWAALLGEAGLDLGRFTPAAPVWVPRVYADTRAAWDGAYSDRPDVKIHVEAAAYRGKPVYFEIFGPWKDRPVAEGSGIAAFTVMAAAILFAGAFLARRNLRLGRGDRRGALRLASFVFALGMIRWVLTAGHVVDPLAEWTLFTRVVAWCLFDGASFWLYYMALEPYVRRLWPETLVSWSRLLSGRLRDPLVGRDILIGSLVCHASILLPVLAIAAPKWLGSPPRVSAHAGLLTLVGGRQLAGGVCAALVFAITISFLYLVLLLLLRILLRRELLVGTAFVLVLSAASVGILGSWFGGFHPVDVLFLGGYASMLYLMLTRVGLLAMVALVLPNGMGLAYPLISADLSAWHSGTFLTIVLVFLVVPLYGFYTSLAGQPLFKDDILRA